MSRWFVCSSELVSGPFTTDEVKAQVTGGQMPGDSLIWGRPEIYWQNLSSWAQTVDAPVTKVAAVASTTAAHNSTVISGEHPAQQQWHYAVDGTSKGPLNRTDLLNDLRAIKNKDEILVWTKGMKAWTDLYEFHDLLDEMGLNRREHARANIGGSVIVKVGEQAYIGQLRSISLGGFGAAQIDSQMAIGQLLNVEIKSEHLGDVVLAKATVQYISEMGYIGFRFQSISQEAKSRITDYIIRLKQSVALPAA